MYIYFIDVHVHVMYIYIHVHVGVLVHVPVATDVAEISVSSRLNSACATYFQNHICVALDNGDVLKCDLEENFNEHTVQREGGSQNQAPATVTKETPKIYQPKVLQMLLLVFYVEFLSDV